MKHIIIHKKSKILTITLNRPEKKNALNIDLLKEFLNILEESKQDPSIRVIVIRGNETCFSSGLDLQESIDTNLSETSTQFIAKIFKALIFSPHVTIASVQGAAIAGGCGIMAACDFAIAHEHSIFGFPEVRKGIIPAFVSVILQKKIPQSFLKELLFLGEIINAKKALSINLINEIVPNEPYERSLEYATFILKGGPETIKKTKEFLNTLQDNMSHHFDLAFKTLLESRNSKEAQEGLISFKEKRLPYWTKDEII